jgi:hypothetical protein
VATIGKQDCKEADLPAFHRRYNEFVRSSPQGIFYCYTWWLDAVAPDQYEILTVESDGQIRAAWPLVWRESSKKRVAHMPSLTQKTGILLSPPDGKYAECLSREQRLTEELLMKLPPGSDLDQRFHENFTNWLPFYWNGFQQTTRYTYVLDDLTNLEQVWSGMRNTVRTEIRKARKNGVRIRETDDLEYFYEVNARTFTRQGMAVPYSLALVQRIDDACIRNAGRKILIGEGPDGRPHAGVYLAYDERCAALILSGGDEELRASGAGSLLHWELIEFASTVTQRFDFEGSMMRPVEFFYRGFGAKQAPYFRIWGCMQRKSDSGISGFTQRVRRRLANLIAP